MYMDELESHFRRENGEQLRDDIPVSGDIGDDKMRDDLGIKIHQVN